MDTSETFVRQCEKAEEIQQARKLNDMEWEAGDWAYWPENGDIDVIYSGEYEPCELGKGHIWLPRQDQLQEMYLHGLGAIHSTDLAVTFGRFADDFHKSEQFPRDHSMEQLWLAFVMKEKYGKVWNGEDWEYEGASKG